MNYPSYPMYKVYAAEFIESEEEGNDRKVALCQRLYVNEEEKKIVFDARDPVDFKTARESWRHGGLNCQARQNDVFMAMIAVAYRRKMIKKFPSETPDVDISIGSNRQTKFESLTIDELKYVCRRFGPRAWTRMQLISVEREKEDFVPQLNSEEMNRLLAEANAFIDNAEPYKIENDQYYYRFNLRDIGFAPNSNWAGWALRQAREGNQKWHLVSWNAAYGPDGYVVAVWRDSENFTDTPRILPCSYFGKYGRRSKRASEG